MIIEIDDDIAAAVVPQTIRSIQDSIWYESEILTSVSAREDGGYNISGVVRP